MFTNKKTPASASVADSAPLPVISYKVIALQGPPEEKVCIATRPDEDAVKLAADLFLISDCDFKVVRCFDYPTLMGADREAHKREEDVALFIHLPK